MSTTCGNGEVELGLTAGRVGVRWRLLGGRAARRERVSHVLEL